MDWPPDPPDPYGDLQGLWAAGSFPLDDEPGPELAALAARLGVHAGTANAAASPYPVYDAAALAHYDALAGPGGDLGLGAGLAPPPFGARPYGVPPQVRYAPPPRGPPPGPRPPRGRAPPPPHGEVNYNKIITKKLASATQFHQARVGGWRGIGLKRWNGTAKRLAAADRASGWRRGVGAAPARAAARGAPPSLVDPPPPPPPPIPGPRRGRHIGPHV